MNILAVLATSPIYQMTKSISYQYASMCIKYEGTRFKVKCFNHMERFYKEEGIKETQLEFKNFIDMGITGTLSILNRKLYLKKHIMHSEAKNETFIDLIFHTVWYIKIYIIP